VPAQLDGNGSLAVGLNQPEIVGEGVAAVSAFASRGHVEQGAGEPVGGFSAAAAHVSVSSVMTPPRIIHLFLVGLKCDAFVDADF
jgi:hypothetical protein